jgi:hypothetical protein
MRQIHLFPHLFRNVGRDESHGETEEFFEGVEEGAVAEEIPVIAKRESARRKKGREGKDILPLHLFRDRLFSDLDSDPSLTFLPLRLTRLSLQTGAVDLSDRGGGDGRFVERVESFEGGETEFFAEDLGGWRRRSVRERREKKEVSKEKGKGKERRENRKNAPSPPPPIPLQAPHQKSPQTPPYKPVATPPPESPYSAPT